MRYHSWDNFTYFSKNNEEYHTFTTSTFRALVNTIVLVKVASTSVKMSCHICYKQRTTVLVTIFLYCNSNLKLKKRVSSATIRSKTLNFSKKDTQILHVCFRSILCQLQTCFVIKGQQISKQNCRAADSPKANIFVQILKSTYHKQM